MQRSQPLLLLATLVLAAALTACGASARSVPIDVHFADERIDTWHGFTRHSFTWDGCPAWVVEPKAARAGNPWSWCMMFPDAFTERCAAPGLLAAGYHHAFIDVGNTFGAPSAVMHLESFHNELVRRGLEQRPALIGISRGGLYAYRFAADHPGEVGAIYGDAPVCDFKSWPGGKGKGKGSPGDWQALLGCYGFPDEAAALAYLGNPIDILPTLAEAHIALIHVVGDADDVVPVAENTAILEQRYLALDGTITVLHKAGVGHHPHGLDDPAPIVEFILTHRQP
ncbi:MAG: alpha/beta hydrolase [Planctomycetes bacterium]|nr:alpha/beta hydrolase [Planctomycetota bacterium]